MSCEWLIVPGWTQRIVLSASGRYGAARSSGRHSQICRSRCSSSKCFILSSLYYWDCDLVVPFSGSVIVHGWLLPSHTFRCRYPVKKPQLLMSLDADLPEALCGCYMITTTLGTFATIWCSVLRTPSSSGLYWKHLEVFICSKACSAIGSRSFNTRNRHLLCCNIALWNQERDRISWAAFGSFVLALGLPGLHRKGVISPVKLCWNSRYTSCPPYSLPHRYPRCCIVIPFSHELPETWVGFPTGFANKFAGNSSNFNFPAFFEFPQCPWT